MPYWRSALWYSRPALTLLSGERAIRRPLFRQWPPRRRKRLLRFHRRLEALLDIVEEQIGLLDGDLEEDEFEEDELYDEPDEAADYANVRDIRDAGERRRTKPRRQVRAPGARG